MPTVKNSVLKYDHTIELGSFGLLTVLLVTVICTGRVLAQKQFPIPRNLEKSKMSANHPELIAHAQQKGESLRIEYTFRNSTFEPVYLFDSLFDAGTAKPVADWAYVAFDGDKAIISRQVWAVPRWVMYDQPEVPFAKLLQPGMECRGEFVLTLPLYQDDPYSHLAHVGKTPDQRLLHAIEFRIGWAIARNIEPVATHEWNGSRLFEFSYPTAVRYQQLISAPVAGRFDMKGIGF
jgi:hypothetical protein